MARGGSVCLGEPRFIGENVFEVPLQSEGEIRKYIGDAFVCEYDGVAVSEVPPSVLTVPALAAVAPVVWLLDAEAQAARADAVFLNALEDCRSAMQEARPDVEFGGHVSAQIVDQHHLEADTGRSVLLFTGGVDSTASLLRHREEKITLVAVRDTGNQRLTDRCWAAMRAGMARTAGDWGAQLCTASRNRSDALNTGALERRFASIARGSWWGQMEHGLALLTLCAPVASSANASTVYIASSHTDRFHEAWGSSPEADESLRWSGARCVHDGWGLSRQDKLSLIVQMCQSGWLQVCISVNGRNCGLCEKCARTVIGLLVAGADPNAFGLPTTRETLSLIQRSLQTGRFAMTPNTLFMWGDIQDHISETPMSKVKGGAEFMAWLKSTDLRLLPGPGQGRGRLTRALGLAARAVLPQSAVERVRRRYLRRLGGGQ